MFAINDLIIPYSLSDTDAGPPAYYGFVKTDGKWRIVKEDSGVWSHVEGVNNYSTNWTNRASLTYTAY